jgi:hypothetical protein
MNKTDVFKKKIEKIILDGSSVSDKRGRQKGQGVVKVLKKLNTKKNNFKLPQPRNCF